jgi:hypothetical protein
MMMPFSRAEVFWVFARYNEAVWPAPIVLYALALVAAFLAFRRSPAGSRGANGILAVMWLWMAVAYHAAFFASVNPLAIVFAIVFAIQSLLFGWLAFRGGTVYQPKEDSAGLAGALLIVFSLAVYPALSIAAGHRYPAQPTFGLPCPTTIFTIGMLAWAGELAPKRLLVIPVLWAAVAASAAIQLGVIEDLSLPVAAIVMVVVRNAVVRRGRSWSMRKGFLRAA